jgi:Chain length determinant protein
MNKVENIELDEDGISLTDIIEFLQQSWKTIALWSGIGLIGGAGFAFLSPPKYLATANIQTAKVAGADVEAPALLVEKLKLPAYYNKETFDACGVSDAVEPGVAIANSLKPTLMKTAPIITISYKAKSQELAVGCINAVMADIRSNQAMIAKPILEQKNVQLGLLKQKLESAEQISNSLQPRKQSFDFNDPKFNGATLLLATSLSKANEVKDLKAQIADIEIQLQEPQTKETYFTTPIYASPRPVEPKKLVSIAAGLFGGSVLSIAFMLVRAQFRKQAKQKNKTAC